jgi:hypothetical protein
MKRILLILAMVLLLTPLANAQGAKFGVGAFGGINIPIAMSDQASGSAFGFKARVKLLPILTVEPNLTLGKWGGPGVVDGVDLEIDGSKITSYGVDATIGHSLGSKGFKPLAALGASIYSIKNDDTGYDESKLGYSLSLGFGFGFSPLIDVDVRGKLVIAPQEDGSKKAVMITGGLNYYFGPSI